MTYALTGQAQSPYPPPETPCVQKVTPCRPLRKRRRVGTLKRGRPLAARPFFTRFAGTRQRSGCEKHQSSSLGPQLTRAREGQSSKSRHPVGSRALVHVHTRVTIAVQGSPRPIRWGKQRRKPLAMLRQVRDRRGNNEKAVEGTSEATTYLSPRNCQFNV